MGLAVALVLTGPVVLVSIGMRCVSSWGCPCEEFCASCKEHRREFFSSLPCFRCMSALYYRCCGDTWKGLWRDNCIMWRQGCLVFVSPLALVIGLAFGIVLLVTLSSIGIAFLLYIFACVLVRVDS